MNFTSQHKNYEAKALLISYFFFFCCDTFSLLVFSNENDTNEALGSQWHNAKRWISINTTISFNSSAFPSLELDVSLFDIMETVMN